MNNIDDIVVVRLLSGEDLVCKLAYTAEEYIEVNHPIIMQLQQTESGESGVMPTPYFPLSDPEQDFRIPRDKIFTITKPNDQIENVFRQLTSRIQLAGANDVPNMKAN